jgi:hypothetical protein
MKAFRSWRCIGIHNPDKSCTRLSLYRRIEGTA